MIGLRIFLAWILYWLVFDYNLLYASISFSCPFCCPYFLRCLSVACKCVRWLLGSSVVRMNRTIQYLSRLRPCSN
ncbi:hypothetical protein BJX68DRAFT_223237 [Aspergillus pseudodeflectus]|uniref:Secreted protein n=1 Tax=Aspergillus pseudodeflectus TaxID=176178 RepID=A0ABR4LED1_9EURO